MAVFTILLSADTGEVERERAFSFVRKAPERKNVKERKKIKSI